MTEVLSDGVAITRGNCLELPWGVYDHVITDPPYEAIMHNAHKTHTIGRGYGKANGRHAKKAVKAGGLGFDEIDHIRDDAARLFEKTSRGWIVAFCTPEGVAPWRDAIEATGVKYKRACVWIKPDAMPQFNGQGPAMGYENFVCAWSGNGHSRWNGGGKHGVYTYGRSSDRTGKHPTEKPLALMMALIADFTQPGDYVFDPFMGSGTTGVACIKLGRKFIGCEMDEKHYQTAKARLLAAINEPPLFGDLPTQTKQRFTGGLIDIMDAAT